MSTTGGPADVDFPVAARELRDDVAMVALAALSGPYLPWGSGTMRPAGLVLVCNDIVLNDRHRVVELGSGISTVLLARLLTRAGRVGGFRMAAIEHDARWGRWVERQLAVEGIGGDVSVVDAALAPHAVDGPPWYDVAALAAGLDGALRGELIDLLIVDGPPAFAPGHGTARYPALPYMRHRLAPGATVVLDDIERPGERELVERWEHEFDLVFDRRAAGVAMATVG